MSEQTDTALQALHKALSLFQSKAEHPDRTKTGKITDTREFQYADLADTWNVIRPLLAETGLSVTQTFKIVDTRTIMVTTVRHTGGGFIDSELPLRSDFRDEKAIGINITYYRRYALQAALGIATEDMADEVDTSALPVQQLTEEQQTQLVELTEQLYGEKIAAKKLQDLGTRLYKEPNIGKWPASDLDRVRSIIKRNAPKTDAAE